MTKFLMISALALALTAAGCTQEAAAPATAANTAAAPEAALDATAIAPVDAYHPLPLGLALAARYHVRDDRLHTTKTGVLRRRSVLELLEQDPATVGTQVAAQLAAAGYKPIQIKDKGDGITRRAFNKPGANRINVNVSSDVGDDPHHPDAIGIISFSWAAAEAPILPIASAAPAARE